MFTVLIICLFFSNNVDTLNDFLTPNMKTTDIRIFFQDRVEVRRMNELPENKGARV